MITSGKHIDLLKSIFPQQIKEPLKNVIKKFRVIGSNYRVAPDFIIAGTRKGGTTSLYNYLVQHPQILRAYEKEIRYFDYNSKKPISWYKSHFPFSLYIKTLKKLKKKKIITGEATPNYIYTKKAIKGLSNINPHIKIIFMLRDPVKRAISDYKYAIRRQAKETVNTTFEKTLDLELEKFKTLNIEDIFENEDSFEIINSKLKYIGAGLYHYQIKNWLKEFPKSQILIIKSEDFFENPKEVHLKVLNFLGVDVISLGKYKNFLEGKNTLNLEKELYDKLHNLYSVENEKLYELIDKKLW